MHLRTIDDIFPKHYLGTPDEAYLKHVVEAHIECAQLPEDLHLWVDRENCPYMREAYATAMMQAFADRAMDPEHAMNGMIRTQVEDQLHRIIRHAQAEQCAEELLHAERMSLAPTAANHSSADDPHIQALERNVAYLQQEINDIKQLLMQQAAPTSAYIWPTYTAHATEDDKRTFEDMMHRLCRSKKKSMTKDIKNYLKAKIDAGIILRSEQISTEYEWVKRFGYPWTEKTYYNG